MTHFERLTAWKQQLRQRTLELNPWLADLPADGNHIDPADTARELAADERERHIEQLERAHDEQWKV